MYLMRCLHLGWFRVIDYRALTGLKLSSVRCAHSLIIISIPYWLDKSRIVLRGSFNIKIYLEHVKQNISFIDISGVRAKKSEKN